MLGDVERNVSERSTAQVLCLCLCVLCVCSLSVLLRLVERVQEGSRGRGEG